MKNLVLGIDPGFGGALGFLDLDRVHVATCIDMPMRKSVQEIDYNKLVESIQFNSHFIEFAIVEDVGARPLDGRGSLAKFMYGAGVIRGILETLKVPVLMAPPAVWKSSMGLSSAKIDSLKRARLLFPKSAKLFARAMDHGRAEAMLLAYWGYEKFLGGENG